MKELQSGELLNIISNIKKYGEDALEDIPRMHLKQIRNFLNEIITEAQMTHHLTAVHAKENGYPEHQCNAQYYAEISNSYKTDLVIKKILDEKLLPKENNESNIKSDTTPLNKIIQEKQDPFNRLLQVALYCRIIDEDITFHNQNSVLKNLNCSISNKSGSLKKYFDDVCSEKIDTSNRFYESDKKRVLKALKKQGDLKKGEDFFEQIEKKHT